MLIVDETRYVPTAVNMVVLQGEDGLYYYMHRSLYDQCVVLYDLYGADTSVLYKILGWEKDVPAVCQEFEDNTPDPVSILAPFLTIVNHHEELDGIEEMCGALSAISMSVDFRRMLKVPMQIRQSVKFSLSVREEYRIQWDRFFNETPTYDDVSFSRHVSSRYTEDDYEDTEDEEPADANPYAGATFIGDDIDLPPLEDLVAAATPATETPAPTPASVTSGPVSGFDMLRGLK